MKEYQNTLLAVKQQATPNAKYNKLIKISLTTEDTDLKSLLEKSAKMYQYYIKPGGWCRRVSLENQGIIPENYSEWAKFTKKADNELITYLELRLENKKPQWQVLAELNGWAPKI